MGERLFSYQTGEKNTFKPLDYVIFGLTLLVSTCIGIFYAVKDRKKQSTKDFLLAGGQMHFLPVSVSLTCSFISAITLLGTPAEMYNYNTMYMWMLLVFIFVMFFVAHVYIPVFYNLKVTSAYHYLEKRFSRGVRVMGTIVFLLHMTTYMPIVLYGPSLALNAVTGFSLWGAVISVGVVCTLYTTLGGMKAVLWTDTFQGVMMVIGILAALIQGCMEVGGITKAFEIAEKYGRVEMLEFDPDPRTRHSVWSVMIGGLFVWTSLYGANQAQVQRTLTLHNLRTSQKAIWFNLPGLWLIVLLTCLIGIVMFAFYHECDPVYFKLVQAGDQIFPLFVMDVLTHVPGIPGLFIASIFSGALSTVSSGLNSLSAVILEDLIRPFCCHDLTDKAATNVSKLIGVIFGCICLGMTYVASKLGGILQAALSVHSIVAGPMLGVFSLGMFLPWSNKWGAFAGVITSILFTSWINVGGMVSKLPGHQNPVRIDGCNWNLTSTLPPHTVSGVPLNFTDTYNTTTVADVVNTATDGPLFISVKKRPLVGEENLYAISYLWYAPLSFLIVMSIGMLVSAITGLTDPQTVDPRLICPIFDILCPYLPEKVRKKLRFGINHKGKWDIPATQSEMVLKPNSTKSFQQFAEVNKGMDRTESDLSTANGSNGSTTDEVVFTIDEKKL